MERAASHDSFLAGHGVEQEERGKQQVGSLAVNVQCMLKFVSK